MRELALLGVHGFVSTVFAIGAVIKGPQSAGAQTEQIVLVIYILAQILAALLIAVAARPAWRVPIAIAAAAAAAWGVWCSIVAGMALSGSLL